MKRSQEEPGLINRMINVEKEGGYKKLHVPG